MVVSFSKIITVHKYYDSEFNDKKGIWETYALDSLRFRNRIKNFQNTYEKMNSVQQLLQCRIKPGLATIVYGNLGRRYKLLMYFLNLLFDDTITIEVRTKNEDIETFCDVLVWFEPEFGEIILKPFYAKCMIVFTSHLNLVYPKTMTIIAYHLGDFTYNFETLINKKIDDMVEDEKTEILHPHFTTYPELKKDSNVILQLFHCKKENDAYLSLLKCFEALKYNEPNINSWRILFPSDNFKNKFQHDIKICKDKLEKATLNSKSTTTCKDRLKNMYLLLDNFY